MFCLALADIVKQTLGLAPVYVPTASPPGQVAWFARPGVVEDFYSITETKR